MELDDIHELHRSGRLDEAQSAYLDFLSQHPNHVDTLHALGVLYAQKNDLKNAIDYFQQAITQQPRNPVLYLNLGNALKIQGSDAQALEVLQEAITLEPNYSAALNNIGTIYYKQKKFTEAETYFRQAITSQTDYIEAHYNLGLTLTRLNQIPDAIAAYKNLLKYAPEHIATCFQLGCLYLQKNQIAQAMQSFLLAESAHPENLETQSNLAVCYLKQGALDQAKIHYLKAYEQAPDDTQILFNIGVINMQQGHLDSAIRFYQRVLRVHPDHFPSHNNLGVAFLSRQHPELALNHFREALRLQPQNEAIRYTVTMLAQDQRLLASPPDYIRTLFDGYADHYDAHLREALDYKIPELLLAAIQKIKSSNSWDILDLGCGTGLCGQSLKPLANTLIGVDLSPKMLELAATKQIYDQLITSGLQDYLKKTILKFDLVVAGDVLVYLGDLQDLFAQIKKVLRTDGLFAFNTEITEAPDYSMNPSGRFAHNAQYLTQLAKQLGFAIAHYETITSRMQNNEPVLGHLYVLKSLN